VLLGPICSCALLPLNQFRHHIKFPSTNACNVVGPDAGPDGGFRYFNS